MAKKFMEKKRNCLLENESGTKEDNNEMLGLECSAICRDVDVDSRQTEVWIWRRMEKISWLIKLLTRNFSED